MEAPDWLIERVAEEIHHQVCGWCHKGPTHLDQHVAEVAVAEVFSHLEQVGNVSDLHWVKSEQAKNAGAGLFDPLYRFTEEET